MDLPSAPGFFTAAFGVFGRTSVAASPSRRLDEPRAVLRDEEVRVGLLRAFEVAAAEHEAVVVGVAARLHQRKRALESVVCRLTVLRVPVHGGLRIGRVETRCPSSRT